MTSINNNQRSSRSSSPAPTTSTTGTSGTSGTSGTDDTSPTSSTNESDLDGIEDLEMSVEPSQVDGMSHSREPTPSAGADKAVAVAKEAFSGVYVSDSDVDKAVTALEKLPPGEARAALEAMKHDKIFSTLLEQAGGDERRRLTDVLMSTGMVGSTTPQVAVLKSALSPVPPTPPQLPVPPRDASGELKEMLHDENIARAETYVREHRDYVTTYRDAIRDAPNIRALRQIGELSEPSLPKWEPGTKNTDKTTPWSTATRQAPDTRTGAVITSKLYELRGEVPPGVDSDITAKGKLIFSENVAASASASYGEDRYGNTTADATASASLAVGPEGGQLHGTGTVGVKTKNGVVTDVTSSAAGGIGGGRTRDKKGHDGDDVKDSSKTTVSADAIKKEVSIGVLEASVEVGKGKLTGELEVVGVKGGVAYEDGKSATVTVGAAGVAVTAGLAEGGGLIGELEAKRKLAIGGMKVEVQVNLKQTVQLASVQDFERFTAVIESGPFETPSELQRGVKWDALNHGAREAYTLYGWDKASWSLEQAGAASVTAGRIAGR